MPAFVYRGDHGLTQCFGLTFPANVPVEVTDERVIAKLRGNAEFAEEEARSRSRVRPVTADTDGD